MNTGKLTVGTSSRNAEQFSAEKIFLYRKLFNFIAFNIYMRKCLNVANAIRSLAVDNSVWINIPDI